MPSFRVPRGTRDLLPDEAARFARFAAVAHDLTARYGYRPIETPVFEQAAVFERGIGEVTDVVEKELFRIARQRGSVLHVGHVERFNGAVQELRKIVERPILIESRRLGPFAPRVQTDSVVMDLMIHDIDIVLGLVDGEPRRVTAVGSSVSSGLADVANVQVVFDSGAMATITASRATEEKIRTLAITQPDAYITLDYLDQDIQIHRRAAQEYSVNREAIRYRQASFVEHLFVHKDNPLKLELRHLISAARAAQTTGRVELAEAEDLRSLAVALEIERMIREGRGETAWPEDLPWSVASA